MNEPMRFDEVHKVYEINLKQREEARWVQVLVLLAKGDYASSAFNAHRMIQQRKYNLLFFTNFRENEANKKKDYSMN
jgi:hypothetical protein